MSKLATIWMLASIMISWNTYAEEPALSITDAKALARKNNTSLQSIREKLVQADIMIDKAWVMVKPQWNVAGSFTHYNEEILFKMSDFNLLLSGIPGAPKLTDTLIQKQDTFGAMTTITQPIFLARAYTTIKSAYKAYDLAKINIDNAEDFLLNNLEIAYYGALTAQKFVAIAKESLQIRKEHLKDATFKFEVGDSTKFNVLRAEIDVNRAEQDLKRAENSLAITKEIIRLLCGKNEDFTLVEPEAPKPPAESIDAFIERALSTRRDLKSAQLSLELGELAKTDAWFRFLPVLAFTGMLRWADLKGFSDKYYSWSVGLALSVPLYDGGLRYAFINEANSKIRDAEIQIEDKSRAIKSEIRQLWLKMEMASANLEKARRSSVLAKEQVQLAKSSFEAGAVTNLEVLDANGISFISEMNEAQEELNLEVAILKLYQALTTFNPAGAAGGADMGGMAGGGAASDMGGGSDKGGGGASGGGAPPGTGM
jgi:multidrug efflux system outer membrane protein